MKKLNLKLWLIAVSVGLAIALVIFFGLRKETSATYTLAVDENGFTPNELTLKVGDRVLFVNKGTNQHWPASNLHPTHELYSEFDPKKPIEPGESWSFTFEREGQWNFHDHLSPGKRGVIKVVNVTESQSQSSQPLSLSSEFPEEQKLWSEKIKTLGAEVAYTEFKEEYKDDNFGKQHSLAHIFGVLLYKSTGIEGVVVCDSTFAFGCYHSFFGAAIAERGLSIIGELDEACRKKWGDRGLGCPHGIGHGIMSSLEEEKLVDALYACSTLSWKGPIGGCTSGVFMEYNFKTMEGTNGLNTRALDEANPHYPCSEVPGDYLQACYFEQPQWWQQVFESDYKKIGSLCAEIQKLEVKEACFRGLGNAIGPASDYTVAKTIERCNQIQDKDNSLLCREGAAWSFYAMPKYESIAYQVCEGLPFDIEKVCNHEADLFNDGDIKKL